MNIGKIVKIGAGFGLGIAAIITLPLLIAGSALAFLGIGIESIGTRATRFVGDRFISLGTALMFPTGVAIAACGVLCTDEPHSYESDDNSLHPGLRNISSDTSENDEPSLEEVENRVIERHFASQSNYNEFKGENSARITLNYNSEKNAENPIMTAINTPISDPASRKRRGAIHPQPLR